MQAVTNAKRLASRISARCGTLSQNGYGTYIVTSRNSSAFDKKFLIKNKKKRTKKFRYYRSVAPPDIPKLIWESANPDLLSIENTIQNKEEQIVGTREKSQQIVAQRLLSCLQYPDATKSSAKDLSFQKVNLWLVGKNFCR